MTLIGINSIIYSLKRSYSHPNSKKYMKDYQAEFLTFAIQNDVLKFGEFTLKSGRLSPYFFNFGLFQSGSSLAKLGDYYAQAIIDSDIEFDMLFGPAYKGIPLVAVVAATLYEKHGLDYPYAYNRKEVKDHGEGGQKAQLAGICISLDRQERGQGDKSAVQEIAETYDISVINIIGLNQVIQYLESSEQDADLLEKISEYRANYGVS